MNIIQNDQSRGDPFSEVTFEVTAFSEMSPIRKKSVSIRKNLFQSFFENFDRHKIALITIHHFLFLRALFLLQMHQYRLRC